MGDKVWSNILGGGGAFYHSQPPGGGGEGGAGGTPIHYLYGYVPPNGGVILKLLI